MKLSEIRRKRNQAAGAIKFLVYKVFSSIQNDVEYIVKVATLFDTPAVRPESRSADRSNCCNNVPIAKGTKNELT